MNYRLFCFRFLVVILSIVPVFSDVSAEDASPVDTVREVLKQKFIDRLSQPVANGGAGLDRASIDAIVSGAQYQFTTEPVPGAICQCVSEGATSGGACTGAVETRKYACLIQPGVTGFQKIFASITNYVMNIALILAVLAIVGLGIAWSIAGGDDFKVKSKIKTWAVNIIVGVCILFFFRYILIFLAPWVFK